MTICHREFYLIKIVTFALNREENQEHEAP